MEHSKNTIKLKGKSVKDLIQMNEINNIAEKKLDSINENEDSISKNNDNNKLLNVNRHLSLKLTQKITIKNPNKKAKIYIAEDIRNDLKDKKKFNDIIYPYITGTEANKKKDNKILKLSMLQNNSNKKSSSVDRYILNWKKEKNVYKSYAFDHGDVYKNYQYNFENKISTILNKSTKNVKNKENPISNKRNSKISKIQVKNYFNTPVVKAINYTNYVNTNFTKENDLNNNAKIFKSNKIMLKGVKDYKVKKIEPLVLGEDENDDNESDKEFNKNKSSSCSDLSNSSSQSEDEKETKNRIKFRPIKSYVLSHPGTSSGLEKENQDNYIIIEDNFFKQNNIYGIFDGHGTNGDNVSEYLKRKFKEYFTDKNNYNLKQTNKEYIDLNKYKIDSKFNSQKLSKMKDLLKANEYEIIKRSIKEIEYGLENEKFETFFSGSTSNLLFLVGDLLICANTGDSRCVLFNCDKEDKWSFEFLSEDHKPTCEKEKERILNNGGEIHPAYDENGISEEIQRIWLPGKQYPGLSLSRSIGDTIAKNIGVTSEPDIICKEITDEAKYIILASDGFWDMITPYDINRTIPLFYAKKDIASGAKKLLNKVLNFWKKDPCDRDDVTFILIFIENQDNKKEEAEGSNNNKILLNLKFSNSGL